MESIPSESVHLLKVKLSLQNDQRWLLLLSWFSKFFGGGPPYPLPDSKICGLFLNQHGSTQAFVKKSEAINWRVKKKQIFPFFICD